MEWRIESGKMKNRRKMKISGGNGNPAAMAAMAASAKYQRRENGGIRKAAQKYQQAKNGAAGEMAWRHGGIGEIRHGRRKRQQRKRHKLK
jgi:hypothetical protein